jgi:tRNA nucleotidyltransferase/poly(A) polymerase
LPVFKDKLKEYKFLETVSILSAETGMKVYIVGGFVRDLILDRPRSEIDFLVLGSGCEFANILAAKLGIESVSLFKNFGTAHFRCGNMDLEFVGARKESYDRSSRKPVVEDGTFEDDIHRRDFTINTLVISVNAEDFGTLTDTFGGVEDIENRIIKTPIDPNLTFDDDPLRIMRAYRFASQLDFDVCDEIHSASKSLAKRLEIVSQERITAEFLKIMASDNPSKGIKMLYDDGVLDVIFPEISALSGVEQRKDFHHKDVFIHTMKVLDNISKVTDNIWLRITALLHDIAKPATKKFYDGIGWTFHGHEEMGARMINKIFNRMRLPLTQLEYVENLVRLHLRPIALVDEGVTDSAVRRLAVLAGENLDDLITLCRADITSKNPQKVKKYLANYEVVMAKVKEVQEKDRLRSFQSPVRGDEIMTICKLKPSKTVGLLKNAIEEAILDGKIGNNYEEAYSYLLEIKEKYLKNN